MAAEQISLEKLSPEKLSLGAGSARQPAEYGLEWGAYGRCRSTQIPTPNEAWPHFSAFNFRPAPAADARAAPSRNASCLDVGVMFDVCLPEDSARPQNSSYQNSSYQNSSYQNSSYQNSSYQNSSYQKAGGDFADVVPLHGDWVALFLGDACGQGAAAALAVPQALYLLRQMLSEVPKSSGTHSLNARASDAQASNAVWDPAQTLRLFNRHLCGSAQPAACASVSLSLAVLNTRTGETLCASAGSEPPLILRSTGQIETVSAGRAALGVEFGRTYQSVDFSLGRGDALLLATDGVTKARNANGGGSTPFLRYEGLTGLALEAFQDGGSPGRIARAVLSGAREFAGGSFHDHAAVLVAALSVMQTRNKRERDGHR